MSDGQPSNGRANLVILNVGGKRFETTHETLSRLPGTRLGDLHTLDPCFDPDSGQYFFDRNPRIFDYILDLYRHGSLHVPHSLCSGFVQQELKFWRIDLNFLENCCWRSVKRSEEEQRKILAVEQLLFASPVVHRVQLVDARGQVVTCWKTRIWNFLEDPMSSRGAMVWGSFFLLVVCVTVAVQCLGTVPACRVPVDARMNMTWERNTKVVMYATTDLHPALQHAEGLCLAVSLLELGARFVCCPCKKLFFMCPYTLVDILSVVSLLSLSVFQWVVPYITLTPALFDAGFFIGILGTFRVLRLVKFSRHYMGVRILLLALKASVREITLFLLIISIGMLIFSTLIYFAEFYSDPSDEFGNIPIGFWWAIVTMTTVGYGDKHPSSGWGYLVGGMCAISGMLCIALPIPIIANNFNIFYTYAKASNWTKREKCADKLCSKKIHTITNSVSGNPNKNNADQAKEEKKSYDLFVSEVQ